MRFKLIIVDDELLMRIGIRSMLDWESHGFRQVGEASNGREALDLALEEKPDLIITDIKMPVMDGLELIRQLSKTLPNCKFVILSSFDEIQYVKEALRLGATDYLIKSEVTPDILSELLAGIREKLMHADGGEGSGQFPTPFDHRESYMHLKERLFKDLISGLLDEREASAKAEQLQLSVRSDSLAVLKLRIDNFGQVRKKYVEQDEKLLRYSIVNILEEIIPGTRHKEIIVESSAEYLLILNTLADNELSARADIERLSAGIQKTMIDFMNLSISIGVSTIVPSFKHIRKAYSEADQAWRRRFFMGYGQVMFFENAAASTDEQLRTEAIPSGERELAFRDMLELKDEGRIHSFLDAFRAELAGVHASERTIRESYIRLTEMINSCIPSALARQLDTSGSPYEAVLTAETWEDVHRIVTDHALRTVKDSRPGDQSGYADMAAELIHRYYSEEISLQSVAGQINVHPSYLSRVFKQEKGENFVAYLTRIRMERAKSYLESRSYKVYEIADKVGYHNYTYFSKLFKKVVGVTPEEYRG